MSLLYDRCSILRSTCSTTRSCDIVGQSPSHDCYSRRLVSHARRETTRTEGGPESRLDCRRDLGHNPKVRSHPFPSLFPVLAAAPMGVVGRRVDPVSPIAQQMWSSSPLVD
jgi:hypothetical protein